MLNLNEESPILTYDNLPKIILPTKDNLWCQIIFQLSHEICHYIFRFKREDQYKKNAAHRYEEIVCETMSLIILKMCAENWKECKISLNKPIYKLNIESYLNNQLRKREIMPQIKIENIYDFNKEEEHAENKRENHYWETYYLYNKLINKKIQFKDILEYYPFKLKNGYIDFDKWKKECDSKNKSISTLSKIQPQLKFK